MDLTWWLLGTQHTSKDPVSATDFGCLRRYHREVLLLSFEQARKQHKDSLVVKELNRVATQLSAVGPEEMHLAGVVWPMRRLLKTIGWRLIDWHTIGDHTGDYIDLCFASSEYVRRYAAFTYNEVLLRRSLKID